MFHLEADLVSILAWQVVAKKVFCGMPVDYRRNTCVFLQYVAIQWNSGTNWISQECTAFALPHVCSVRPRFAAQSLTLLCEVMPSESNQI